MLGNLWQLFVSFTKVGIFGYGGGPSLIPLVKVELDLMSVQTQQAASSLSAVIRDRLEGYFARLNIKRATQDLVARALVTLPLMQAHDQGTGWPKWLTRKSYFGMGLQLFELYGEACGKREVAEVAFPAAPAPSTARSRSASGGGGSRGPSFAPGTEGGVFGFRKK